MNKGKDDLIINSKAEVDEIFRQYLLRINNPYMFNFNGIKIKVVFSSKKNAPTMESALVKIASKRGE